MIAFTLPQLDFVIIMSNSIGDIAGCIIINLNKIKSFSKQIKDVPGYIEIKLDPIYSQYDLLPFELVECQKAGATRNAG